MSNASFFNPALENQYLETGLNGEFEDLELENLEGLSMETLEGNFEGEGENWELGSMEAGSFEGETLEGDRFLGGLLRRLAPRIAQTVGGLVAGGPGANIARQIAGAVLREQQMEMNGEFTGEFSNEFAGEFAGEFSGEGEGQFETMLEASGISMEVLGEMAQLAEMAAEATNEQEADRFFGAIANLAGQILPNLLGEAQGEGISQESIVNESVFEGEGDRFLPLLGLAAPLIGKAVRGIARAVVPHAARGIRNAVRGMGRAALRAPRRLRPRIIRAMPQVALRTAMRTASALRNARPATPAAVNQVIAGAAARPIVQTFASPRAVALAVRRNRQWARQYNFVARGTVSVTPRRRRFS